MCDTLSSVSYIAPVTWYTLHPSFTTLMNYSTHKFLDYLIIYYLFGIFSNVQ